jgi:hypothetical protein
VPAPQFALLAEQGKLLGSVLPDRIEHPVPAPGLFAQHDRFLHEPAEGIEQGAHGERFPGTHAFGGLQVETAGEHRQASPQPLFLRRAQLMTPADRRAQCLMTVVAGSGRTEKQEAIIEPGDDLLDRHGAQPHGGAFEGERDAVQRAAQLDHWLLIRGGEREPGHHRLGPVSKQGHRVSPGGGLVGVGYLERRDQVRLLPPDTERLPAGRQDPQPGSG